MKNNKNIGQYRHLAFALVGGFFAGYAILCRCGLLANAQTMNLIELVMSALRGDIVAVLLHIGGLVLYIAGTMLTVLLPHYFNLNMQRAVPFIDALACIVLCFIPADANPLLGLYPMFFAMSIQWSSFSGAKGYVSSTIFSTNNVKQASLAFAQFITDGDKKNSDKVLFYVFTILAFSLGAAVSYIAVSLMGVRGAWVNIILIANAYYMVVCEEGYELGKLKDREIMPKEIAM